VRSQRSFAPGDQVLVALFGAGVVRETRNEGRYLVEVQGRAMVVTADRLTPVEPRRRASRAAAPGRLIDERRSPAAPAAPASIDLHGMTAAEATDALDAFLSDAILAGHAQVRVIHGRSGGRLKAAVHARLRVLPSVRTFTVDPSNPGMTLVTL
jgi:DNA mismatch repair protein MutS2